MFLIGKRGYILLIVFMMLIPTVLFAQGDIGSSSVLTSTNGRSIVPMITEQGPISVSVDGLGTLAGSGTLQIEKPAGATVRGAYFMAASSGFSNFQIPNGAVSINGTGINWGNSLQSSINSWNHWADVTSLVAPALNVAPTGLVSFTIAETNSLNIDGTILAVIFDDPNQPADATNSVILMFGAQNVNGDLFTINLGSPLDTTDPDLRLDFGLGISFGAQASGINGQFSQIDVNGVRLTTAAGGEDDGTTNDGALLTVGGVGDSNANPADPFATDSNDPSLDDELYSLIPFVVHGDTSITVSTLNPSNDDNIFFSYLSASTIALINATPTPTPTPSSAPPAVPEPITIILFGSGAAAIGAYARKRKKDVETETNTAV